MGTASAGERHMMLVPEKSREGTSTAPRPAGIAANTASISFGGDQRDVGQHGANGSRTLGNQRRGGERDRDVEAARKLLVDSERIRGRAIASRPGVGRHHGDVVGGKWRRARRPARRETSPRPAHVARRAAARARAGSWRIRAAWLRSRIKRTAYLYNLTTAGNPKGNMGRRITLLNVKTPPWVSTGVTPTPNIWKSTSGHLLEKVTGSAIQDGRGSRLDAFSC